MEATVDILIAVEADSDDPMRILRRVMVQAMDLLKATEAVVIRQDPQGDLENIRASGSLDDAAIAEIILARLPRPLPARRPVSNGPLMVLPLDVYHLALLVPDEGVRDAQSLGLVELLCRHAGQAMENARLRAKLSQNEGLATVGRAVKRVMHDLRNPIGQIHVAVERANVAGTDGATVRRMHSIITSAADTMLGIANEISELTSADKITKIRITAESLLAALQDSCMQIAVPLRLVNEHSGAIHCDPQKLLRAFTRLLEHVYGPRGLLAPEAGAAPQPVEVRVTQGKTHTQLTVGQGGPSIPESLHARMFEPFAVHTHQGTKGLALAIVQSVISAHGGDITVVTDSGAAYFAVSLPVAP